MINLCEVLISTVLGGLINAREDVCKKLHVLDICVLYLMKLSKTLMFLSDVLMSYETD